MNSNVMKAIFINNFAHTQMTLCLRPAVYVELNVAMLMQC